MPIIEILGSVVNLRIIYNPFDITNVVKDELVFQKGASLAHYLDGLPMPETWLVGVNGEPIEPERFARFIPKENDTITLVHTPEGGDAKDIIRIVALIALAIYAPQLAAAWLPNFGAFTAFAEAVGTIAIMVGGSMLINSLLPPPSPDLNTSETNTTYGIDGAKNTARPGSVVPVIYGTHRYGGNIVDLYTQNVGDTQYVYVRTVLNDGEVDAITDIEINGQPIENFSDITTRISLGTDPAPDNDWFVDAIALQHVGTEVLTTPTIYDTTADVDRLRLDFLAPRGLVEFNGDGKALKRSVAMTVQYREQGATDWLPFPTSLWQTFTTQTPANTTKVRVNATAVPSALGGLLFANNITAQYRAVGATDWITMGLAEGTTYQPAPATFLHSTRYSYDGTDNTIQYLRQFEANVAPGIYETRLTGGELVSKQAYAPNGASSNFTMSGSSTAAIRQSLESSTLPRGSYQVRVSRTTAPSTVTTIADNVYLSDVGEIDNSNINYNGTATLSLKIKMGEQINGLPTVTALVRGSLLKQWDEVGELLTEEYSANPAWAALDVLNNQLRGAALADSKFDWPSWVEWAEFCAENDLEFNGVFDYKSNVWDALNTICRVGRAQPVRIGSKYGIVIDKAAPITGEFTGANILKDSLTVTWLPISDRANEIELSYFDKEDGYKQKTIRLTDDTVAMPGETRRVSSFSQIGITNIAQATEEAELQLRRNKLLRKNIQLDAPLEAISSQFGDVVVVHHDAADYTHGIGGRLETGSTTTVLKLDRDVTLEADVDYKALVYQEAFSRYIVTIESISGTNVYISGLPDGEIDRVTRIRQGSVDLSIINIHDAAPHDRLVVEDSEGLVTGSAALWTTHTVEERNVTTAAGTVSEVTLDEELSVAPPQYAKFIVGRSETVKQLFRVVGIAGEDLHRRTISLVNYSDDLYLPPGAALPTPEIVPVRTGDQVTDLSFNYMDVNAGSTQRHFVDLTWNTPDLTNYGGADIYLDEDSKGWVRLGSVIDVTRFRYELLNGSTLLFKVVGFNREGRRANSSAAPVIFAGVATNDLEVPEITVTSELVEGATSQRPAIVVSWTAPEDSRVTKVRVEVKPTAGGPTSVAERDGDLVGDNQLLITEGISESTGYTVRARFESTEFRSAWCDDETVTSADTFHVPSAGEAESAAPGGDLDTAITDIQTEQTTQQALIDDLYVIYGDTDSAALYAAAAAAAADIAEDARDVANTAADNAETAQAAAEAAQAAADAILDDTEAAQLAAAASQTAAALSATAASGSATAASGSATSANTYATTANTAATNASTANTNAQAAKTAAQTAETNATTQATNSANSATAAAGSSTSASGFATNASNSATASAESATASAASATAAAASASGASGSATAAASSASAASTSATNAGTYSSAASSSAVTAQSVANRLLPDRPSNPNDFVQTAGSSPDASTALSQGTTVTGVTNEGDVREFTTRTFLYNRGVLPVIAGHTYRVQARVRVTVDGASNRARFGLSYCDPSYAVLANNLTVADASFVVADGWQTFTLDVTATTILAAQSTTAYVRGLFITNDTAANTNSGSTTQVAFLSLRDITAEAAAASSATAAATSASNAATSETNAGSSASAANTSALSAATQASNASTSATNAATSATSAAGSASTATTQAGLAAGSATAAGGSATAAAGSASSASTSATNAGNSATSASASSVSAQSVANRLLPDRPSNANDFVTASGAGAPDSATAMTAGTTVTVTGEGDVRQFTTIQNIYTRGGLAVGTGKTFRLTHRSRVTVDGTGNELDSGFALFDSSWAFITSLSFATDDASHVAADGWQNFTKDTTSTAILAAQPTAAYIRARIRGGGNSGATASGATWQLASVSLRDITSEAAAGASATAAATSASNAATSETNAGSSASAANTSATNAATSASGASTSASNASNSATSAAGSASTATTQATNAANSATAAGGSATAAAGSASSASTSATNAGNSATSSASSAVSAQSVANNLLPDIASVLADFSNASTTSGTPSTLTAAAGGTIVTGVTNEGDVRQFTSLNTIVTRGWLQVGTGRTFTSTVRTAVTVDGTGSQLFLGFSAYAADGTYLGNVNYTAVDTAHVVADGWQQHSATTTSSAILTAFPTAAFVRGKMGAGRNSGGTASGATWQISILRMRDTTSEAAALASATAAATSASNASTSETNAGSFASAANTSATNANTSAGNANTSATNASNSATTASGHASTASTQATAAANSATSAQSSVNRLLPDRPSVAADFTQTSNTSPDSATVYGQGTVQTVTNEGDVRQFTSRVALYSRGVMAVSTGRTFRNSVRQRVTVDGTSNRAVVGFHVLDASYTSLGFLNRTVDSAFTVADGWQNHVVETTSALIVASYATAAYIRAYTLPGDTSGGTYSGSTVQIASMRLTDVTSEVSASGSASAAATSASAASTSATNAGNSATAASASAVTARSAVNRFLPERPGEDQAAFTAAYSTYSNPADLTGGSVVSVTGEGSVYDWSGLNDIATKGLITLVTGRTIRVTHRTRITTDGTGTNTISVWVRSFDATGTYLAAHTVNAAQDSGATVAKGWQTLTGDITVASILAAQPTAVYVRADMRVGGATGNAWQVAFLQFRDATAEVGAASSASAAATSASAANTSATNAGTSASAASGSATAANTSAGNASASASAAATSASGAAGSATTASTQATLATNYYLNRLASQLADRPAVFEDFTNSSGNGTPSAIAASTLGSLVNVANEGDVREYTAVTGVLTRGWLPVIAGRQYRATIRYRVTVNGTADFQAAAFVAYDSSGNVLGTAVQDIYGAVAADGWKTVVVNYSAERIWATYSTAAYVRVRLTVNTNGTTSSGATSQIGIIRFEDVSNESNSNPNLLANSTAALGSKNWTLNTWAPQFRDGAGWCFERAFTGAGTVTPTQVFSDQIATGAGIDICLSAIVSHSGISTGRVRWYVSALNSGGTFISNVLYIDTDNGQGFRSAYGRTPANTAFLQVYSDSATFTSSATGYVRISQIKLEKGTSPTPWSNEGDFAATNARLGTAEAAIVTNASAITSETSARTTEDTTLRASISSTGAGLLSNAKFTLPVTSGLAYGWSDWSSNAAANNSAVTRIGQANTFAYRMVGGAAASSGVSQTINTTGIVRAGCSYIMRGTTWLQSGTYNGAGVYLDWRDSSNASVATVKLEFANTPNTSGVTANNHVGMTTWEKRVTAPTNAVRLIIYAMTHWSSMNGGVSVANSIDWYECDLLPESYSSAGVNEVRTAVADSSGAYSYYGMKVGAGNRFASIEALASTKTNVSQLKMTADKFTVATATLDKQVFTVTADTVSINADLDVGGSISVGAARLKVALESIKKTGADGATITWAGGVSIGSTPEYVLDLSSLAPLAANEQYSVSLSGASATGATVYAKIVTPGTTTAVTQTTDAAGGGGNPDRVMAKTDSADAYDNNYEFRVQGTMRVTSTNEGGGLYTHEGSIYISTWFNDGGGWDEGPTIWLNETDVGISHTSGSSQTGTYSFDVLASITWANPIGAGSTYDFGVTLDNPGFGQSLTDLTSVSYYKQTSTGLRTASPSGQTVKITAFPRNA